MYVNDDGVTNLDTKLLLILNPKAGMKRANKYLADMIGIFEDAGYVCQVCVTRKSGDARGFVETFGKDAALVVCIGGDGTLNEVVDGMMRSGCKACIGYIPAGSTNDFGSSLGLSHDVLQAARDAVEGRVRTLDVCAFNDRYYAYVASCGAFTNVCYSTAQPAKNVLGRLAYFLEGVKDVSQIRPIAMRIETAEGQVFENDYLFAAFSNATSIAGVLEMDKDAVDMNDGLFELLLVEAPDTMQELGHIVYSLLTQQYHARFLTFCATQKVRIEIDCDVDWTLDGEVAKGAAQICIENIPDAIRVMVPKR